MVAALWVLGLLQGAFWIALSLNRARSWPRDHVLTPPPVDSVSSLTSHRMGGVIPARDEAVGIAATVTSLLEQAEVDLELVVVDDGSTDATAEEARRAAGTLGREITVLRIEERAEGWSGKVHALSAGVRHLTDSSSHGAAPEWLLFSDADIRHHPGSLVSLVQRAESGGYDLVSVMARLHAGTVWERLLVPPFVFFFQLLYPFRAVANPASSVAAAAGGCVLVRRLALERAGGVAAIRDALIDDVALGRAVKGGGGRTWLGFDPEICSTRVYATLDSLWQMVARSAFVQLHYRWDWLFGVVFGLAVFFVGPPVVALVAGWKWLGEPSTRLAAAAGSSLLAWALQARALVPSVRHHRVGAGWAWTLPLSSALYGAMTVSAAWNHLRGRSTSWKGRVYPQG